jgi:hypothetical protein
MAGAVLAKGCGKHAPKAVALFISTFEESFNLADSDMAKGFSTREEAEQEHHRMKRRKPH